MACGVLLCAGCGGGGGSTAGSTIEGTAVQSSAATAPPAGGSGSTIFAGAQPWTVDVSGAEKSDRSDAIIGTLGTNIWIFTDPLGPAAFFSGLPDPSTLAGQFEALLRSVKSVADASVVAGGHLGTVAAPR